VGRHQYRLKTDDASLGATIEQKGALTELPVLNRNFCQSACTHARRAVVETRMGLNAASTTGSTGGGGGLLSLRHPG